MAKSEQFKPDQLDESDEWHIDETVVKIKGEKYYLWTMIDSETRFVVSFNLSPYRSSSAATEILYDAKKNHGKPNTIVFRSV